MAKKGKMTTPTKSEPWPGDQLLRSRGFAILARPNNTHSVWGRAGKEYMYDEAVVIARREQRAEEDRTRDEIGY